MTTTDHAEIVRAALRLYASACERAIVFARSIGADEQEIAGYVARHGDALAMANGTRFKRGPGFAFVAVEVE